MTSARDIDRHIRQLHRQAGEALDRRVHAEIDAALANEQKDTHPVRRRLIMTSSIMKLAAAAAVVVATLLGVNIINGPHGGVAWAQIPDRMAAVDTFMFHLAISVSDANLAGAAPKPTGEWTFYFSEEHGFRMDMQGGGTVISWYVPPTGDTITMVIPSAKKWSRTPLPPDQLDKWSQEYEDPAEYIQRFLAHGYKELGRSVIDGIEVEGIEVANPPVLQGKLENGVGRMWVDVQTELPIRIEIEGTAGSKAVQYFMEFKWSEAVDPSVFEPNISGDYTPLVP
jgi:outer membrane lipoprotein-sorting protein